jgi:hypothetical protein
MVRPTRSIVVTGIPILAVRPETQSAENKISLGLFSRQSTFCFVQGTEVVANAWAIAKVASDGRGPWRKLRDVDARLAGNLGQPLGCTGIGRFPRDFCSAASRKGAPL